MYATLLLSDTVHPYGRGKTVKSPVGLDLCKKVKDLIASKREESGHGKGVGVYPTLLPSNKPHPYGLEKADTSPVGVQMYKKQRT